MCQHGTHKRVEICGEFIDIDACIADQVQVIASRGIRTIQCCCGHGSSGTAILQIRDGQEALIKRHGYRLDRTDGPFIWLTTRHDPDELY